MTDRKTVEIYIAMNEDGDYEVHRDQDEAAQALEENYGGTAVRIVKMTVKMRAPDVVEGPEVTIPDDAGETIEAAQAILPGT